MAKRTGSNVDAMAVRLATTRLSAESRAHAGEENYQPGNLDDYVAHAKGVLAPLPASAASSLKEGHVTSFGNGQKWTLNNGEPERVR
jgi:hypothetical protein